MLGLEKAREVSAPNSVDRRVIWLPFGISSDMNGIISIVEAVIG
jgi:hypothetical protein